MNHFHLYWVHFANLGLSGTEFTTESSDMSFLCSRFIFLVLQAQCKKQTICQKNGESSTLLPSTVFLKLEMLCRGANRHPLCRDTESSWPK